MVYKEIEGEKPKRKNPLIGLLLLLISIALLFTTGLFGFVFGLLHQLFTKGLRGIGEYALKIAISMDQLGNVMMQHLFNLIWIKKGGYKFGNRDETISSVLGKNKRLQMLTSFGKAIDHILDFIDPNHSLNSIDYFIEPLEETL